MTATASVLRQIARASVGLLVAGAIAGQAAPAFAAEVRPVAQGATLAPASDQGVDPTGPGDQGAGGQVDLTPGGPTDLTRSGRTDLTPGPGSGTGSWDSATAVVTDTDGETTTLKARTVAYCISAGNSLPLTAGQDVPFEKMSRFEVTHSDAQFAPNGKADVTISLAAGGEVSGTFDSNCDLIGYSDVGRFSIYPQKLRSVEFHRGGATDGTDGTDATDATDGLDSKGSSSEGSEGSSEGTSEGSSEGTDGQVSGTFEVTGTEPTAINIVTDPAGPDGQASRYNVPLPYKGTFTAPADVDTLQVVVVGGGTPTCTITFGGKVVAAQDEKGNGHCVYQRIK